jgi:hypothetical protein
MVMLAVMIFWFYNDKEFVDQLNNFGIWGSQSDNFKEYHLRNW